MSPPSSLLLLCICSSALAVGVTVPLPLLPSNAPTAYEVLESYNFPVGLLPQGATGYDLNSQTGEFTAYLNGSCSFSLQGSYQLRYQSKISGRISTNRLQDLKGVSVKVLLFWVNIVEVERRGDVLEFSVGIASADFPIDNFDESPKCGCGTDCVNLKRKEEEEEGVSVRLRGSF